MRLNRLQIRNFIGAREVDIAIPTPICVLAGDNDAGKTSIFEAIALAMTGEMARVSLKKDYDQVVTEGAKDGSIVVDSTIGSSSFQVPSGKWGESINDEGKAFAPVIRYVLNAQRFASMDETMRRKFLFGLMRSGMSSDIVAERLKRREFVTESMVAEILPTLTKHGFEPASKEAAKKATVLKGSWQEVTGERWGASKAQAWRAPVPDYDQDGFARAEAELASARADLEAAQQELGRIAGLQEAAKTRDIRITELDLRVSKLPEARIGVQKAEDEITFRRDELAAAQQRLTELVDGTGSGPARPIRVRTAVTDTAAIDAPPQMLVDAVSVIRELYEIASDSAGVADLGDTGKVTPWGALPLFDRAVDVILAFNRSHPDYASPAEIEIPESDIAANANSENQKARDAAAQRVRDLDAKLKAAEEALQKARNRVAGLAADQDTLAALRKEKADKTPTQEHIDAHRTKMAAIRTTIAALDASTASQRDAANKAKAAAEKTRRAAEHHEGITGWDAVAKALAPDGIPGEILGETIAPLNALLKTISQQSEWPLVQIGADMSIRVDGRHYGLWSESGRWRADAALAAMIAAQSGIKYVVLDRIDVLSLHNRGKLMKWLAVATRSGFLDGALVLGTLKAQPTGLPVQTFTTAWLENGRIAAQQKQAA